MEFEKSSLEEPAHDSKAKRIPTCPTGHNKCLVCCLCAEHNCVELAWRVNLLCSHIWNTVSLTQKLYHRAGKGTEKATESIKGIEVSPLLSLEALNFREGEGNLYIAFTVSQIGVQ